jgi:hypothetical protein
VFDYRQPSSVEGEMFGIPRRSDSSAAQRQLSYVRARTRDLIEIANRAAREHGAGGGMRGESESTRPEDLRGVREITFAQRELLGVIREAMACGVSIERIADDGVRSTAARALVVSDVAWEALSHVVRQASETSLQRAG